MSQRQSGVSFPIATWSAWAPGVESVEAWRDWAAGRLQPQATGAPVLPFVDPLLRRRLGRAARMALHVAGACIPKSVPVRTVFASRHGELHRTVGMLRHLAHGEDISPTEFALSVHNAAAGVHSIVHADRSAGTSIVGGEETFAYGLLEAANQWRADTTRPVLFVYSDEPVPNEYRTFVRESEFPHALALLLTGEGDTIVRVNRHATPAPTGAAEMQSLRFLGAWLRQDTDTTWYGARAVWVWHIGPRTET